MSGIYIHYPFCRKKCNYCNFYSVASKKLKTRVAECIAMELQQQKQFFDKNISTIYFGGGTPSMMEKPELDCIFNSLNKNYNINNVIETTIETNPDDINSEKLALWKSYNIDRISLGVQSFYDSSLKYLNRTHNSNQIKKAIEDIGEAGFENISIDLIYGIPTLTEKEWSETLEMVVNMRIPHISAYSLTIEKKTELYWQLSKGVRKAFDEEKAISHYNILTKTLQKAGYIHYEISNFCLPGFKAKHNSSYWEHKPYLGVGPSAHSFDGKNRKWNVCNIEQYINSVKNGKVDAQEEMLSDNDLFNEYIMVSLRTIEGISLKYIEEKFGREKLDYLKNQLVGLLEDEKLVKNYENIFVSDKYRLFTDGISADLFIV